MFAFHICNFGILEIYLCVYVLCIALFSFAYLHLSRKVFEGGVRLTLYTFFAFVGRGNQLTYNFSAPAAGKNQTIPCGLLVVVRAFPTTQVNILLLGRTFVRSPFCLHVVSTLGKVNSQGKLNTRLVLTSLVPTRASKTIRTAW